MTLRPQTRDYIAKLSDQELFEYLCQEDYEPEAIAFAKAEFDRRKLDPQQVTTLAAVADSHVKVASRGWGDGGWRRGRKK